MKYIATIIAIIIPILAFAQHEDRAYDPPIIEAWTAECFTEGFADSTTVGGCDVFIYITPALDLAGNPIEVVYERKRSEYYNSVRDSVLIYWPGHRFYQSPTDSLTLWESMQAYNFALRQIFPK